MAYQDTSNIEETGKYFWPCSRKKNALFESKEDEINIIPRWQTGYLYCVVCNSQMHKNTFWERHIKGKRHFINSQNFEFSSEEPSVQKELDTETRPIVGLDHIYEVLHRNHRISYQCLLCPAGLKNSECLMKHIFGLEHQMAFLKEHVKEKFSHVNSSELAKSEMESVVQNIISDYEREYGKGKMVVMKAKKTPGYYIPPPKKHYNFVNIFHPQYANYYTPRKSFRYSPIKYPRMDEKNSESEWKRLPVDDGTRERRHAAKPYHSDAKVSNIIPKSSFYSKSPVHSQVQDTGLEREMFYNSDLSSRYERGNRGDLEKKTIRKTVNVAKPSSIVSASDSPPNELEEDYDALFRLVDDFSPELFLRLALFKFNKMDVKEERELKLLDRVANKVSTLALKAKKKLPAKRLKTTYEETLDPNSTSSHDPSLMNIYSHDNLQFNRNLDNFIGHYKGHKTSVLENTFFQNSHFADSKSSDRNKPMSQYHLNSDSDDQNIPEIEVVYDSGLNRG